MHPKLIKALLAMTSAIGAVIALPVSAQSISINGATACTYTTYTVSAGSNGLPSFNFTANGCNMGNSTPTAGTMQFSAANFATISIGGTTNVTVTNTGRVLGGGNTLSGTVTSATPAICTVPANSNVLFSDSQTAPVTVTVTGVAAGTCSVSLAGAGTASPSQASLSVVDPAQPGVIAFTTASQSATPAGPSVTFTVAQSGAGATSPAAGVTFLCTATASNNASWTPVFTPGATGQLAWASGENTNKTFTATVPALPSGATSGTITCQLSSPTGSGVTVGSPASHVVTAANVAAPACTISASPTSLTAGTGGTVSFSSNCTNSPNSYAWTAVTSGAPAISGSGNTASASFGTSVAAGNYQYQLIATNAGGNSAAATATVTVSPAPSAACVVKDRASQYPDWLAGNGYNTANPPNISQGANDTYAYRFAISDLLDPTLAGSATGAFQLYESAINVYHSVSVTVNPCEYTDTVNTTAGQCQISNSSGSIGIRFAHWNHPASTPVLTTNNYCRLPNPGAQQFLYVNVRFAGPPNITPSNPNPITAPITSSCTTGACGYYPLYIRF